MLRTSPFAVLLFLAVSTVSGDDTVEKIDNPEFTIWAKFKPGTTVTLKTITDAGAVKSESVVTSTLKTVGAEEHVVEVSVVSRLDGKEFKGEPRKRVVEKRIVLPKGVNRETYGKKPDGTVEEGTETIKVAGAEYKAKWYRMKSENNGVKVEGKLWLSDDVPGQLLKGETSLSGAIASKSVMELTEFKKP